jgi:hypothetical protein
MNASRDSLRAVLREQHIPEPSKDLLPRILASRAAGARVVLPRGGAPLVRWRLVGVWLAAAVLTVLGIGLARWLGSESNGDASRGDALYAALLRGTVVWPAPGSAQRASSTPRRARYPLVVEFDPQHVTGGTWVYERRTTIDDVLTQSTGRSTLSASSVDFDGAPAWVVTTQRGPVSDAHDSLWVSRGTLRPLRYALIANKGRTRILQLYSPDSVRETIDIIGPSGRHFQGAVALPGPRHAPVLASAHSASDLTLLTQALPLRRGWRGSVYTVGLVSPGGRMPPVTPLDLRVTARDRVTVPAGTFDCWRLEVAQPLPSGEYRSTAWVSVDQRWVVKAQDRGGDFVSEQLLVSYGASPSR